MEALSTIFVDPAGLYLVINFVIIKKPEIAMGNIIFCVPIYSTEHFLLGDAKIGRLTITSVIS